MRSSLQALTFCCAALLCGTASAASGPAAFDGVYSGTRQRVAGTDASCPAAGPISVQVTNGQFHLPWRASSDAVVRISAAGGYSAMLEGSFVTADKHMQVLPRIDGRADGHALIGEYGTRWCKYSYRLDRG